MMGLRSWLNDKCSPVSGVEPRGFGPPVGPTGEVYRGAWWYTETQDSMVEQPVGLDMTDLRMVNGDYK
jgi:hypothetical protein